MRIRVRLFAGMRDRAGADAVELELPEGAVVADALERMRPLTGELQVVMAVNREYARAETMLHADDELALIPPVSGGMGEAVSEGVGEAVSEGVGEAVSERGAEAVSEGVGEAVSERGGPPVSQGVAEAVPERGAEAVSERSAGDRPIHVRVTSDPLALAPLLATVRDPRAGAIVVFEGVTREVAQLEYEAYAEMASEKIRTIASAACERHEVCAAAVVHRIGTVPLSEPSVVVAVSAPHRDAAFVAAREIIDRLKAEAPIWKREEGEWVEGETPQAAG